MKRRSSVKLLSAWATAFVFAFQTLAWSAPGVSIAAGRQEVLSKSSALADQIDLPYYLGEIQSRHTQANADATLIHIQDAHSNLSAQKNIREILHQLNRRHKINLVLFEGAFGELAPVRMDYFESAADNQKAAEQFEKEALISGGERFLLDKYWDKDSAKGFGVENPELYRRNIQQFRQVLAAREETTAWLEKTKTELTTEASKAFSKDLRDFFREWSFYQDNHDEMIRHFEALGAHARRHLSLDLNNADAQLDWPQLARLRRLKDVENQINTQLFAVEQKQINEWILKNLSNNESAQAFKTAFLSVDESSKTQNVDLRATAEKFFHAARPLGFLFSTYPELSKSFAKSILQSELNAESLFSEMNILAEKIFRTLAKTSEEKEILEKYETYLLLRKLFALELTRKEYVELTSQKINLAVSEGIYQKALGFYETAIAREEDLFARAKAIMSEQGQPTAVLITGGFHSQGLSEKFKTQFSYVDILPRIQDLKASNNYLHLMTLGASPRAAADHPHWLDAALEIHLPDESEQMSATANHILAQISGTRLPRTQVKAAPEFSAARLSQSLKDSEDAEPRRDAPRSEARMGTKIPKLTAEQNQLIDIAALAYGLKKEFRDYLAQMMIQAWHPDLVKEPLRIKGGPQQAGNYRLTAQLSTEEIKTIFRAYNFIQDMSNNQSYADAAKNAFVEVFSLDGGLGENLGREVFLEMLIKAKLLDEKDVRDPETGKIKIGAKPSDLGFILSLERKGRKTKSQRFISIAEAKLLQLIHIAQTGKFSGLKIKPLLNDQSAASYVKLLQKPYLQDWKDGKRSPRTYEQVLKEIGLEMVYEKTADGKNQFYIAQNIPAIRVDGDKAIEPAQRAGIGVDIHGGHGMISFDVFHSPENWKPRPDGKPTFIWFSNGDGLNSSNISEFLIGKMLLDRIPIMNLLTEAAKIDMKGGKNGVKIVSVELRGGVKVEIEVAAQMELADAKAEGQAKEFQAAGIYEILDYFGVDSIGKQKFNTNIFAINMDLIMPVLAKIKEVLGEEDYLRIITASRIRKPLKKGNDGNFYMPIDGAIGTSIHNLNEFIMTTRNEKVLNILKEHGLAKSEKKKGDSNTRLWGQPFLHFTDMPRGIVFTPTKTPFDPWMQAFSDYYHLDPISFVLKDGRAGLIPPRVELSGGGKWWNDIGNLIKSFGVNGKIQDLSLLEIKGPVILAKKGKALTLGNDVRIYNTTGVTVDFHSPKYRETFKQLGIIDEQGSTKLDNVTIVITPYGVVTSQFKRLADILRNQSDLRAKLVFGDVTQEGVAEADKPQTRDILTLLQEALAQGSYRKTLEVAQDMALLVKDLKKSDLSIVEREALKQVDREIETIRRVLSYSWGYHRMKDAIVEFADHKREPIYDKLQLESLQTGINAWLRGKEELGISFFEVAIPDTTEISAQEMDKLSRPFLTALDHGRDSIRYFLRVIISIKLEKIRQQIEKGTPAYLSQFEQVEEAVATSNYSQAFSLVTKLINQIRTGNHSKTSNPIIKNLESLNLNLSARTHHYERFARVSRAQKTASAVTPAARPESRTGAPRAELRLVGGNFNVETYLGANEISQQDVVAVAKVSRKILPGVLSREAVKSLLVGIDEENNQTARAWQNQREKFLGVLTEAGYGWVAEAIAKGEQTAQLVIPVEAGVDLSLLVKLALVSGIQKTDFLVSGISERESGELQKQVNAQIAELGGTLPGFQIRVHAAVEAKDIERLSQRLLAVPEILKGMASDNADDLKAVLAIRGVQPMLSEKLKKQYDILLMVAAAYLRDQAEAQALGKILNLDEWLNAHNFDAGAFVSVMLAALQALEASA